MVLVSWVAAGYFNNKYVGELKRNEHTFYFLLEILGIAWVGETPLFTPCPKSVVDVSDGS
jgi:hypothetical protein